MVFINRIVRYYPYAFLARKFTLTLMTFIGIIASFVTILLGWIFLHEPVSLFFFISYSIVLIGFFFFSKEEFAYNVK